MPAGTVGFRAVGKVEAVDYTSVLDPAVAALLKDHDKINLVYVVGDDFDRYSLGALWEDTKFGARNPRVWGRIALATDHDWLRHAMAVFSPIIPGECRVFPVAQLDDAVSWIGNGR